MARYIDGDKLKERMLKYYECLEERAKGRPYKGDALMGYEVVDMIEDCIDSVPTVNVTEVRHGTWIVSKTEFGWNGCEYPSEYTCSVCGRTDKHEENYCPECGAKMDKNELLENPEQLDLRPISCGAKMDKGVMV